jgi:hypothetical protein
MAGFQMTGGPRCPGRAKALPKVVGTGTGSFRVSYCLSHLPSGPISSTMKGSRAISEATEGTPEGMDLSLIGLPPPMSQHPSSASATKPIVRSVSIATGSEPRRKTLVSVGVRVGSSNGGGTWPLDTVPYMSTCLTSLAIWGRKDLDLTWS